MDAGKKEGGWPLGNKAAIRLRFGTATFTGEDSPVGASQGGVSQDEPAGSASVAPAVQAVYGSAVQAVYGSEAQAACESAAQVAYESAASACGRAEFYLPLLLLTLLGCLLLTLGRQRPGLLLLLRFLQLLFLRHLLLLLHLGLALLV